MIDPGDVTAPVEWVCAQCVKDGLTPPPDLDRVRVSHGICGPHGDILYNVPRWARQRAAA